MPCAGLYMAATCHEGLGRWIRLYLKSCMLLSGMKRALDDPGAGSRYGIKGASKVYTRLRIRELVSKARTDYGMHYHGHMYS